MIHPDDAAAYQIKNGDSVKVESPHGTAVMKAKVSDGFKRGIVVLDFGWGNPWDDPQTSANALSAEDVWDPISGGTANRLFYCSVQKLLN